MSYKLEIIEFILVDK